MSQLSLAEFPKHVCAWHTESLRLLFDGEILGLGSGTLVSPIPLPLWAYCLHSSAMGCLEVLSELASHGWHQESALCCLLLSPTAVTCRPLTLLLLFPATDWVHEAAMSMHAMTKVRRQSRVLHLPSTQPHPERVVGGNCSSDKDMDPFRERTPLISTCMKVLKKQKLAWRLPSPPFKVDFEGPCYQ